MGGVEFRGVVCILLVLGREVMFVNSITKKNINKVLVQNNEQVYSLLLQGMYVRTCMH